MVKTKINTSKKSIKQLRVKNSLYIAIGIVILIVIGGAVGYEINSWQANQTSTVNNDRKARIIAIYDSLKLGPEYQLTSSNIFGDKRVYSYDSSRTYSSSQTYERGANVDTTVAELRKAIEAAGFTYFEEPYPGSAFTELHFKSAKNEYLRLNVSSKLRDDAFRNAILMNNDQSTATSMDPNTGPSNVIIKVNLDDNNE